MTTSPSSRREEEDDEVHPLDRAKSRLDEIAAIVQTTRRAGATAPASDPADTLKESPPTWTPEKQRST